MQKILNSRMMVSRQKNGDLESSFVNLSQGIIEDIFSPHQPQSIDELCNVFEDLVNIDFNDIETPNDIDEADELEATFTLENMELGLAMLGRRCRCFPSGEYNIRRQRLYT